MTDIILKILDDIAEYFLVASAIVFLQSFYDPDIKWSKKKALSLGITSVAEFTATLIYDHTIIYALFLVVQLAVAVWDCGKRRVRKALKIILTQFVFLICTINSTMVVAMYISPNYNINSIEPTEFENYSTAIINIIFFVSIFLYLSLRITGKGLFIPVTKKERILLRCYLFYSFILFCTASLSIESRVNVYPTALQVVMGINTILLSILLPVLIYLNRISEFFRESTEYQQVYLQAELQHFKQYKSSQEETKRFRHDIKNNLICLNEMLTQGKIEEGTKYLKALVGEVHSLSQKYVSGDEILDSIISTKACIMEEANIAFSLDGVLAGGLNIEPIDICSIFANALDNAIESTTHLSPDQRYIKMKLKSTNKLWHIKITNPAETNVDSKSLFNNGYTTKKGKTHHGIGTFNIKRTVEKHGGAVQAKCEDCVFTLEIILPRE